jgi:hypothetical protein
MSIDGKIYVRGSALFAPAANHLGRRRDSLQEREELRKMPAPGR